MDSHVAMPSNNLNMPRVHIRSVCMLYVVINYFFLKHNIHTCGQLNSGYACAAYQNNPFFFGLQLPHTPQSLRAACTPLHATAPLLRPSVGGAMHARVLKTHTGGGA